MLRIVVTLGALLCSTLAWSQARPTDAGGPTNAVQICPNLPEVARQMQYPPEALAANVLTGEVHLRFFIGRDGRAQSVQIVSSTDPLFNAAALSTVAALRCSAAGSDQPVEWTVAFRMAR